ncbi:hypothetical protein [Longimicrobium terrae]|uniref:Uncharacterized protein n=1 Tax=Longimicrobium terrae TaxID=1639882 RepID=A0A841GZT3_9BACT|nr:hypothetical protein [Longimicrobium terrae]MBB4636765.1 hypothetical protein [Longimicrobium terrae]MBB6071236.1 hypothetical protein [Longimicrobium terrae]NNC29282.1 hypothetical protein [Longimicrobium terrae]
MPINPTEYLSVLVSIVVGLGISHLLSGAGKLVVARRRVRMYLPTLLSMVLVFLAHVQFWWGNLGYGSEVENNYFAFLLFLLNPVLLYLMAVLVLPDFDTQGELSLRDHYHENRVWFYGMLTIIPALSIFRNVLIQHDDLITPERPYEIIFMLLGLSAVLIRAERWHRILPFVVLAFFMSMMLLTGLRPG